MNLHPLPSPFPGSSTAANISQQRQLKLDTIKIDRSFVTDMMTNSEDAKLVEAIVNFSRALGLDCTAEGIETDAVREQLQGLGCTTGQGFFFNEPQPSAEIQRQMAEDSRKRA